MRIRLSNFGSKNKKDSLASKVFATLFLSVFGAMGSFFAAMLIRELIQGKAPWYIAFFLIVPGVFMLVGFGGIWGVWFAKKKDPSKVSKTANQKAGKRAAVLFGLVFVVVGLIFTYMLLIRPLMLSYQAQNWAETRCRIVSARVESHSSDDGTTYSVEIDYEYEFNGQTYRADRYDFIGGSSSGREGKEKVVKYYRNLKNPICYVDPDNPKSAVLVRKIGAKNAIGLFPLIFVVVGIVIMMAGLHRGRHVHGIPWLPETGKEIEDGMRLLRPKSKPVLRFVITFIGCLVWNGFVVFMIHEAFDKRQTGFSVFTIIFTLGGVGWIAAVIHTFLSIFNPKYLLMIQPDTICPGTTGAISWKAFGKSGRVGTLSIKLIGQEEATYRRGTDTYTDKIEFFEMELTHTQDAGEIAMGQMGFAIPDDTMHSFEANNNKIVWMIKLHADVPRWPDVKQDYKITVYPKPIEEEATL